MLFTSLILLGMLSVSIYCPCSVCQSIAHAQWVNLSVSCAFSFWIHWSKPSKIWTWANRSQELLFAFSVAIELDRHWLLVRAFAQGLAVGFEIPFREELCVCLACSSYILFIYSKLILNWSQLVHAVWTDCLLCTLCRQSRWVNVSFQFIYCAFIFCLSVIFLQWRLK